MLKKLFDWTPRDFAQWEAIREKGAGHFVTWFGVYLFGGIMFLLLGGLAIFIWMRDRAAAAVVNMQNLIFLALQLLFIAGICLIGGLIVSTVTWVMEETIYQKIIQRKTEEERINE